VKSFIGFVSRGCIGAEWRRGLMNFSSAANGVSDDFYNGERSVLLLGGQRNSIRAELEIRLMSVEGFGPM